MLYTTPNNGPASILGTTTDEIDTPKQGSDRILLVAVVLLMIFGVLAVYSSIAFFAETRGTTANALVTAHMVKLAIAFIAMLVISKIDYHKVAQVSRAVVLLSWVLLVAVIIYGDVVFGARRSLTIAGISFQPSTIATVSLLIHVCVMLGQKQEYIKDFKRTFLPILFWVIPTCALVGLEDFSSAALLLGICLILMVVGRASVLQTGVLVLIGALGAGALVSTSAERQSRVQEYVQQVQEINSSQLEPGAGYQAQQSYIAIARGKLFGVGIAKSTQRDFLPAPYNDFIFSIIAEEYGITGAGFVLLLFLTILYRGIVVIARQAPDTLGILIATACTLTIALYGFVNAAVASGLLPVTGLPMPFVSYGGTSTVFAAIMVGILLNISKHGKMKGKQFYFG